MVSKGERLGGGGMLGVWDGNVIKLGCDDHCTTTNVINSLSNIKNNKKKIHDVMEILLWLSRLRTLLVSMRMKAQSLASLSGLRI